MDYISAKSCFDKKSKVLFLTVPTPGLTVSGSILVIAKNHVFWWAESIKKGPIATEREDKRQRDVSGKRLHSVVND